jgi:uncharacterized protein YqgV (UPF0045/DUF77 family)
MKATCDISLYPFSDKYKKTIVDFIKRLKKNKKLAVETNGMSTQVFGDYDVILEALKKEMGSTFKKNKAMFVLKIAKGERTATKLPKTLRSK